MSRTQLSSHNVNKVFDSLRSFLQSWLIFPSPTSCSTQRAPVPRSQPGFADSVLPPNRPIQLHLQHRQQNGAAFCANYTATPDRDIPIVQNTNMQIHTRRDAPRKSSRRKGRLPLEMMISTSEIASYSDAADVEAGSSVKGSVFASSSCIATIRSLMDTTALLPPLSILRVLLRVKRRAFPHLP